TDTQGNFSVEGLPAGRTVQLVVAPDVMEGRYVPDTREVTIPDGQSSFDVGTLRLVRGQIMQALEGETGIMAANRNERALGGHVKPDSPAARAGVQPAETIVTIDGRDVSGVGSAGIGFLLGGRPGTQVAVGLVPASGGQARVVTLTRVA